MSRNPFRYFNTSPQIIQLAVMMYVRFLLSLRNVEDLLHERGSMSAMKRYDNPEVVVTDRLASYRAAMKMTGNQDRQEVGRHLNNWAENSYLPFRRHERAMRRFRQMRSLQKFASVHTSAHNHFNHQRNIERRARFKDLRTAALLEWRWLFTT